MEEGHLPEIVEGQHLAGIKVSQPSFSFEIPVILGPVPGAGPVAQRLGDGVGGLKREPVFQAADRRELCRVVGRIAIGSPGRDRGKSWERPKRIRIDSAFSYLDVGPDLV